MRMLQCIQKKIISFCPQKIEKNTLKSCSEKLKSTFFSLTASTAQMSQTEELMFQNVAYRPTVYITGSLMKKKSDALSGITSTHFGLSNFNLLSRVHSSTMY